jgi:hypothetical protein
MDKNDFVHDKDIVRSMIQHEDDVLNHRLVWMLAVQSLLVTALGIFWGKEVLASWTIISFGLVSNLSFMYSLSVSHNAIEDLKKKWKNKFPDDDPKDLPTLQSDPNCKVMFMPWKLLPILVFLMWFILGILYAFRCG